MVDSEVQENKKLNELFSLSRDTYEQQHILMAENSPLFVLTINEIRTKI